jgi:hypothetical protein
MALYTGKVSWPFSAPVEAIPGMSYEVLGGG